MELRPELPELPARMKSLRRHRGYPVPWFVGDVDGVPDFRVIGPDKVEQAAQGNRCWVCGQTMGRYKAYTIGPMCAINRISAEPPSHRECAIFSAVACPFLSRPHMVRRTAGLPEETVKPPGEMIERNPGAILVWVTTKLIRDRSGLFNIGDPVETLWFASGRAATREEVQESIDSGLPILREAAEEEGPRALRELENMTEAALRLLPA